MEIMYCFCVYFCCLCVCIVINIIRIVLIISLVNSSIKFIGMGFFLKVLWNKIFSLFCDRFSSFERQMIRLYIVLKVWKLKILVLQFDIVVQQKGWQSMNKVMLVQVVYVYGSMLRILMRVVIEMRVESIMVVLVWLSVMLMKGIESNFFIGRVILKKLLILIVFFLFLKRVLYWG